MGPRLDRKQDGARALSQSRSALGQHVGDRSVGRNGLKSMPRQRDLGALVAARDPRARRAPLMSRGGDAVLLLQQPRTQTFAVIWYSGNTKFCP